MRTMPTCHLPFIPVAFRIIGKTRKVRHANISREAANRPAGRQES